MCGPVSPWLDVAFVHLSRLQHSTLCRGQAARLMVVGEPMSLGVGLQAGRSEVSASEGFGSIFSTISHGLAVASGEGRSLVLNVAGWSYGGDAACMTSAQDKAAAPWNCLFEPLSACTFNDALHGEEEDRKAGVPPGLTRGDESVWRRHHARYLHKDWARYEAAERGAMAFPLTRPPAFVAAGGSRFDWLASVRAYLRATALPTTEAALDTYGGLPEGDGPVIGLHLRLGDRGGGAEGLADTWAAYMTTADRARAVTGASRMLIATDMDVGDSAFRALLVDAASRGYTIRVVPQRVPVRLHESESMADFLLRHPVHRANATFDALAAADLLGRCNVLVGRRYSTLLNLAESLQRARSCRSAHQSRWTIDTASASVSLLSMQGFNGDDEWVDE